MLSRKEKRELPEKRTPYLQRGISRHFYGEFHMNFFNVLIILEILQDMIHSMGAREIFRTFGGVNVSTSLVQTNLKRRE